MGFVRGQPDWSRSGAKEFTGAGGSDTELAARLNWPMSQILLGEVWFYDGFEAPILQWLDNSSGDQPGAKLVGTPVNSGNQAVYIYSPVGADEYGYIDRGMIMPNGTTVGLGAFIKKDFGRGRIELFVRTSYQNVSHVFEFYYTLDDGLTQIYSSGALVSLGTYPQLYTGSNQYAWFQLVVDAENGVYKSVTLGSRRFELTQPSESSSANPYEDYLEFALTYTGTDAFSTGMYVDDVIVTRNEP